METATEIADGVAAGAEVQGVGHTASDTGLVNDTTGPQTTGATDTVTSVIAGTETGTGTVVTVTETEIGIGIVVNEVEGVIAATEMVSAITATEIEVGIGIVGNEAEGAIALVTTGRRTRSELNEGTNERPPAGPRALV